MIGRYEHDARPVRYAGITKPLYIQGKEQVFDRSYHADRRHHRVILTLMCYFSLTPVEHWRRVLSQAPRRPISRYPLPSSETHTPDILQRFRRFSSSRIGRAHGTTRAYGGKRRASKRGHRRQGKLPDAERWISIALGFGTQGAFSSPARPCFSYFLCVIQTTASVVGDTHQSRRTSTKFLSTRTLYVDHFSAAASKWDLMFFHDEIVGAPNELAVVQARRPLLPPRVAC